MKRTVLSLGLALTVGMSTVVPSALAVDLVGRAVLPAATFDLGQLLGSSSPPPMVSLCPL
jgi:hypothetical protein